MYIKMYTSIVAKKHSYAVGEARANLSGILTEVDAGNDVYLTRRGRPVAVVLSTRAYEALRDERPSFRDAYSTFIEAHGLGDLPASYLGSLRDRSPGRKVRL
jgi:prevent-host-death family protein